MCELRGKPLRGSIGKNRRVRGTRAQHRQLCDQLAYGALAQNAHHVAGFHAVGDQQASNSGDALFKLLGGQPRAVGCQHAAHSRNASNQLPDCLGRLGNGAVRGAQVRAFVVKQHRKVMQLDVWRGGSGQQHAFDAAGDAGDGGLIKQRRIELDGELRGQVGGRVVGTQEHVHVHVKAGHLGIVRQDRRRHTGRGRECGRQVLQANTHRCQWMMSLRPARSELPNQHVKRHTAVLSGLQVRGPNAVHQLPEIRVAGKRRPQNQQVDKAPHRSLIHATMAARHRRGQRNILTTTQPRQHRSHGGMHDHKRRGIQSAGRLVHGLHLRIAQRIGRQHALRRAFRVARAIQGKRQGAGHVSQLLLPVLPVARFLAGAFPRILPDGDDASG